MSTLLANANMDGLKSPKAFDLQKTLDQISNITSTSLEEAHKEKISTLHANLPALLNALEQSLDFDASNLELEYTNKAKKLFSVFDKEKERRIVETFDKCYETFKKGIGADRVIDILMNELRGHSNEWPIFVSLFAVSIMHSDLDYKLDNAYIMIQCIPESANDLLHTTREIVEQIVSRENQRPGLPKADSL